MRNSKHMHFAISQVNIYMDKYNQLNYFTPFIILIHFWNIYIIMFNWDAIIYQYNLHCDEIWYKNVFETNL